jgi:predicted Zn-dependent protease
LFTSGYVNMTTNRFWMGRFVEALASMDEGIATVPGPGLLARPFNLFFAGRVDEAETLLKSRIDAGATLVPLEEVTLGYLSLKRGRFDEAAARFSSGTAARALTNLAFTLITAVAYFQAERPAEGASYLARAVDAKPQCAQWAWQVPALAPYRETQEFRRVVNR